MSEVNRLPIGIFDSGVGGLSVLRAIQKELPDESLLYVADQAHVPYGPRKLEEVREFSEGITRFMISQGAKLMVVACNAASAASLQYLRQVFPEMPFVGMEPAVKPAAEHSDNKVVAVLATPATFQGALYASVVERFANGVVLLQDTCPGLVEQIELGNLDKPETRTILEKALLPMLARDADTVVLGCTHYPFVIPMIQAICGPGVRVIDPAPAVARQVRRVMMERKLLHSIDEHSKGNVIFYTTGVPDSFKSALLTLLGLNSEVKYLYWDNIDQTLHQGI
jgi:glutamate racemase